MKKELDEALCKDFPGLYADRFAPMSQTCMCWGFDCGDGWEPIIRKLSEQLIALIAKEDPHTRDSYRASQIKEKYGTLRCYLTCSTEEMEEFISEAEHLSSITCEECGAPGKLRNTGWLFTHCDACHTKREEERRARHEKYS